MWIVTNVTQQTSVADRALVAATFTARIVGWLRRNRAEAGEALIIPRCNMIHTWFMRVPIDVVFLNKTSCVLKTVQHVGPFRLAWAWGADTVIELPAGQVRKARIDAGSTLRLFAATPCNT